MVTLTAQSGSTTFRRKLAPGCLLVYYHIVTNVDHPSQNRATRGPLTASERGSRPVLHPKISDFRTSREGFCNGILPPVVMLGYYARTTGPCYLGICKNSQGWPCVREREYLRPGADLPPSNPNLVFLIATPFSRTRGFRNPPDPAVLQKTS